MIELNSKAHLEAVERFEPGPFVAVFNLTLRRMRHELLRRILLVDARRLIERQSARRYHP